MTTLDVVELLSKLPLPGVLLVLGLKFGPAIVAILARIEAKLDVVLAAIESQRARSSEIGENVAVIRDRDERAPTGSYPTVQAPRAPLPSNPRRNP